MISTILYGLEEAVTYVKNHPQIQFAFLLILVLPLLFLYSSQQFLEAGRANQDKLQRDRVGLLHDSFVAILQATDFNSEVAHLEIKELVAVNPDITKFRVVEQVRDQFVPVAALNETVLYQPELDIMLYQSATVRFDESLIFPFTQGGDRYWQSVRALQSSDGRNFFILTETSFIQVDRYLADREMSAYFSLALVYLVLIAIAYWLIRLTNYQAMYTKMQAAVKTKDLFTNMIAHELRAPLTAIRGYASMLREGDLQTTEKEQAERIEQSSERLLTIVNDLLDVARIQSGRLAVEKAPTNVSLVISEVLAELSVSAAAKQIDLEATGIDVPHEVLADSKRLHQALTNLVSNAIKYTKEGSIELSVESKTRELEIRVKDTGMGISAEDQQQLFAPFFRVNSSDVSTITGTGLGMWITRQLIELMGAKIAVESIKGVGTHVVISIPKTTT